MTQLAEAKVHSNESGQVILLPADIHIAADHVFVRRSSDTGVIELSEIPFLRTQGDKTLDQILADFKAAGIDDVDFERDRSLPREIDL